MIRTLRSARLPKPATRPRVRLERLAWLPAALLTLPALTPLFRPGFFESHDGRFHVYRLAALENAWRQGVLYPRLFPEFGFGYGQAVLNFYAALSYVPGATFAALGLSPATALEVTIALGFLLAAMAAYGMGRYWWGKAGGIVAALLYTYLPYRFADAYVRGAMPEHFAFVWPPLILWATSGIFREAKPTRPLLWAALAWAGLVYTHNLTVLMLAPVWLLFVAVLAVWTRRWRRAWLAAGSGALGAGLSAWLWLPFLAERRFVGLSAAPSEGYREHLRSLAELIQSGLFYNYGEAPQSAPIYAVSWPILAVLFLVAVALVAGWVRRRPLPAAPVAGFGLAAGAVSVYLMSTASLASWEAGGPLLANLQYPWRFMVTACLGVALAAGALAGGLAEWLSRRGAGGRSRRGVVIAVTACAVLLVAMAVHPLPRLELQPLDIPRSATYGPERMWQEDAAAGQVGATWTGEFLPVTVSEQRWALGRAREGAMDGLALETIPAMRLTSIGYQHVEIAFESNPPPEVLLHQFYLPHWMAIVDGRRTGTQPAGELGLVRVRLPPGTRSARLEFAPSPTWIASSLVVATGVLVWAFVMWRNASGPVRSRRWRRMVACIMIGWLIVDLSSVLGLGAHAWQPRPVSSQLEDVALLVGYDVRSEGEGRSDEQLAVTLYWFALRETSQNFKSFVHLQDGSGQVVAQHDGDPVGGFTPTTRWRQGELIADPHRLILPASLAGDLTLLAGMYELSDGEGSPAVRNLIPNPPSPDGRVLLGQVTLAE